MKRACLALLCAGSFVLTSPASFATAASTDNPARWRAFFAQVLPLAPKNFSSIKGAYLPHDDVYAVKVRFDPKLVTNCHVFVTGATPQWHMRCDTLGYDSLPSLVADVGAALPSFSKGANLMGEPQWTDKQHQTFVTIVAFGGILVSHGDPDAD